MKERGGRRKINFWRHFSDTHFRCLPLPPRLRRDDRTRDTSTLLAVSAAPDRETMCRVRQQADGEGE